MQEEFRKINNTNLSYSNFGRFRNDVTGKIIVPLEKYKFLKRTRASIIINIENLNINN